MAGLRKHFSDTGNWFPRLEVVVVNSDKRLLTSGLLLVPIFRHRTTPMPYPRLSECYHRQLHLNSTVGTVCCQYLILHWFTYEYVYRILYNDYALDRLYVETLYYWYVYTEAKAAPLIKRSPLSLFGKGHPGSVLFSSTYIN